MQRVQRLQTGFTWLQVMIAGMVTIALGLGLWAWFPVKPKPSGATIVRGYIAVAVGDKESIGAAATPGEEIYLPSIQIVLREVGTTNDSPPSITDLSGRFTTVV